MDEFSAAMRDTWRPLIEERNQARLLWYWELTHGTGASYQAVTLTAVRDWATWGSLVERQLHDPRLREWQKLAWTLRKEVTAKVLLATPWSPLADIDLSATPIVHDVSEPTLYLHYTGWPFPGKLEEYVEALGTIFYPQTRNAKMISVEACWRTAPGTGKHHEVVLLQKITDWSQFSRLLTRGEQSHQRSGWMVEGLRFRDQWESKLLRCARWSPRQ